MNLSRRVHEPEIMDTGTVHDQDMREGLEFLRFTNRVFGGSGLMIRALKQFAASWKPNEPIRILDVGCGLGDIPIAIAEWAARHSYPVQITGLDAVPQICRLAKSHTFQKSNIRIIKGNIFSEDFKSCSYDYVTASLFLHHLEDDQLRFILKKFDQIASRGIVVSDLLRSRVSYWAVALASKCFGNGMVRHDGPLSVRRAFTLLELKQIAVESGLDYLKVRKEPFFRISLSGQKG